MPLTIFTPESRLQASRRLRTSILRWDAKHLGLHLQYLRSQNNSSTRSIVASSGPVVSLTTYGLRTNSVYLTIESIAAQKELPSRVMLWLDKPSERSTIPESLKRLESRGLEIRETVDFGPHKKYFPYVQTSLDLEQPLITADDDVIYPRYWLGELAAAYRDAPDCVNCHRAHSIRLDGATIASYSMWKACKSSAPSFLHFATGVSGTILPPRLLKRLKQQGAAFSDLCPTADDIWLHVNAIRSGLRIRQIKPWSANFPEIPGTQEKTLSHLNFHASQNDVQITKTYNLADLTRLSSEEL